MYHPLGIWLLNGIGTTTDASAHESQSTPGGEKVTVEVEHSHVQEASGGFDYTSAPLLHSISGQD